MKLLVIPVPKKRWESLDLASASEDATDAGRRIGKRIDINRERIRFSVACSRIEKIAIQNLENEGIYLQDDAGDILENALRNDGITYPFVLPTDMPRLLKNLKSGALASLNRIQGGIVVIPVPYRDQPHNHGVVRTVREPIKSAIEPQIILPELDTEREYIGNRQLIDIAHRQIREALSSNHPLNASYIPHEVFTEVIRCYLYRKIGSISFWQSLKRWLISLLGQQQALGPQAMLRIAYSDGSEGKTFPILYLFEKQRPTGLPVIKAGLMSMRHSESLDTLVDVYLLRNKEIDGRDTYAEQDTMSYERMLQFLEDLLRLKDKFELHLYHTGLEPAVVGSYRAVVEILHKYHNRLVVVPVFIRKDGYKQAEPWF